MCQLSLYIEGALNTLEAARQNRVENFVYASSSSIYGGEPNLPKTYGGEGNLFSPNVLTKHCDVEWEKKVAIECYKENL